MPKVYKFTCNIFCCTMLETTPDPPKPDNTSEPILVPEPELDNPKIPKSIAQSMKEFAYEEKEEN